MSNVDKAISTITRLEDDLFIKQVIAEHKERTRMRNRAKRFSKKIRRSGF